jgi:hypothetical protein
MFDERQNLNICNYTLFDTKIYLYKMTYRNIQNMMAMFLLILGFLFPHNNEAAVAGNKKKKKGTPAVVAPPAPKSPVEDLNKKVEGMEKIEGLFTFYRDTLSGSVMMAVKANQIDESFIYFTYSENGPVSTGHFRGSFRETKVFRIERYFNRLEFVTINPRFYFDSSNALYRSKDANVVPGMMVSEKIVAMSKDGQTYLISADNIFLKETMHQVKPSPNPIMESLGMFGLGALNATKTRYEQVRSYPKNSDVVVKYVFENPYPRGASGSYLAENRYVEVLIQHSIIQVPKNNFKPRLDDQRVGYFTTQSNDMTTFDAVNYRDFIHRWHLEKKDPSLPLSEPVEPLVFWIENTTPLPYRPIIEKALLSWNLAFEKAGFINAIQVKVQPDTADWDAGDIRYNVLRWTSSPNPPFGGYGPSFVNPLTGQILGADIMLEFVFLTGRLSKDKLFNLAAMPEYPADWFVEMLHSYGQEESQLQHDMCAMGCQLGSHMQQQIQFGKHLQKVLHDEHQEENISRFMEEALYYLVLHEVGHTLGLSHNMRASQYLSPDELQDISITRQKGVIASVMDYPALNFPQKKGIEVQQYNTSPGPYDIWAITYGYSPSLEDEQAEKDRLNAILSRSVEQELRFGNDADDMRSPGKGIDPRVNIFDLSNDPVLFASRRMTLIEEVMKTLPGKYISPDQSYHELRNAFFVLTGEYTTMADIVSRFIGGVYAERQLPGQTPGVKPLTPVSLKDQKRAMKVLTDQVFSPHAFQYTDSLLPYLQPQRRGFGFFSLTEDPKMHDRILNLQSYPLNHLLAPTTMKRISDSRLYGNEYTLHQMMMDINAALFSADIRSNVSSTRQNLQIFYVQLLVSRLTGPFKNMYDHLSRAAMYQAAVDVKKMVQSGLLSGNEESKAHRRYVIFLIDELLESKK